MNDIVDVDGGDDDDALLLLLEQLVLEDRILDVVVHLAEEKGRAGGEDEERDVRHHMIHVGKTLSHLLPSLLTPPASSMQDSIFLWSTPAVFMALLMHEVSVKRDLRLGRGGRGKGEGRARGGKGGRRMVGSATKIYLIC